MSSLSSSHFQHPAVGDALDIFILRSELHQGALSALFLAEDQLSLEKVVLKIPSGDILNQPILLYHYQNEERISRRLDHPGIVRFINRQRSRQYIIMEYLSGRDLRSLVGKNRSLALDTALSLMLQLCDVAAYLHGQHIIHLDLKPENILLHQDLKIKVIDFGLASCRDLPDLLAIDLKNPQGTPWYISPEQLLGERADLRCDIYAMGMIFYEMLTGRLPWSRSSKISVARRRLRYDPTPPRYYNPDIPPQIQTIVLRAITRHTGDRYPSAAEMRHDLKNWQELPSTPAGKNSKPVPLWKRVFPGKAVTKNSLQPHWENAAATKPQIVGAVIDSPCCDNIVLELKKQSLIRNFEVTLVHVIEEESDSHFIRYGVAVEGEKLMARLERAVQLLRRCGIDPNIRLIRGEPVDVLREITADLQAELLVLGKSRKKKGLLFEASVRERLQKQCPCPVLTTEGERFSPANELKNYHPDRLSAEQVLACDIFLVDLWYEHLHYHTDFIYTKLLKPGQAVDLSEENCMFGRWLHTLNDQPSWHEVVTMLAPIHSQFHQIAARMAELADSDHTGLHNLYLEKSLPLSCRLKEELGRVSRYLRSHLAEKPPLISFLTEETCPVTMTHLDCYGPLQLAFNLDRDLSALVKKKEKK